MSIVFSDLIDADDNTDLRWHIACEIEPLQQSQVFLTWVSRYKAGYIASWVQYQLQKSWGTWG